MSDAVTYYRVHWNWGTVPFDADNAYSYMIGPEGGQPGTEQCTGCWGARSGCGTCGGTGRVNAQRGYSCCTSPEDLLRSAEQMSWEGNGSLDAARVVAFEGEQWGYGCDGEPLVVPSRVLRVVTWDEFTAETAENV